METNQLKCFKCIQLIRNLIHANCDQNFNECVHTLHHIEECKKPMKLSCSSWSYQMISETYCRETMVIFCYLSTFSCYRYELNLFMCIYMCIYLYIDISMYLYIMHGLVFPNSRVASRWYCQIYLFFMMLFLSSPFRRYDWIF